MIKYKYFISYSHSRGHGCSECVTDSKITTWEQIQEKKHIEDKGLAKEVVILNFIKLKEEEVLDEDINS